MLHAKGSRPARTRTGLKRTCIIFRTFDRFDFDVLKYVLLLLLHFRLDGMYKTNFLRVYPNAATDKAGATDKAWSDSRKMLALICASREPLPVQLVAHMLNWDNEQQLEFLKTTGLGLLFPIKDDNCFHVYHKTVVDWLRDQKRHASGEVFVITDKEVYAAHVTLGKAASKLLETAMSSNALPWGGIETLLSYHSPSNKLGPELLYLIRHGARHFVDAAKMAPTEKLRLEARNWAIKLLSDVVVAENRIVQGQYTDMLIDLGDLGGDENLVADLQAFFQANRSLLVSHAHATLQQVKVSFGLLCLIFSVCISSHLLG